MRVLKVWTYGSQGGYIVLERVTLETGDSTSVIRASDFQLTVSLLNGDRKTYDPIQGALGPMVGFGFLGSLTTKRLVEPAEDLNGLGSVTIPAHGSKTLVISFAIADYVSTSAITSGDLSWK
jgi:hypothetical protein